MDMEIGGCDGYVLFTLAGKVDWDGARRLDEAVARSIANGSTHFVFDLSGVSFLCSGAVGALTYNLNKVRPLNGAFHVISSSEPVNEVLETLHFDAVVGGRLYRSLDEFRSHVLEKDKDGNR